MKIIIQESSFNASTVFVLHESILNFKLDFMNNNSNFHSYISNMELTVCKITYKYHFSSSRFNPIKQRNILTENIPIQNVFRSSKFCDFLYPIKRIIQLFGNNHSVLNAKVNPLGHPNIPSKLR